MPELGHALVEQPVDVDRAVVEVPLRQPQRHAERHEPLLGAVVEVALEAAALLVADLHQSGPARLDLLAARAESSSRSRTTSTRVLLRAGDLAQQLG